MVMWCGGEQPAGGVAMPLRECISLNASSCCHHICHRGGAQQAEIAAQELYVLLWSIFRMNAVTPGVGCGGCGLCSTGTSHRAARGAWGVGVLDIATLTRRAQGP